MNLIINNHFIPRDRCIELLNDVEILDFSVDCENPVLIKYIAHTAKQQEPVLNIIRERHNNFYIILMYKVFQEYFFETKQPQPEGVFVMLASRNIRAFEMHVAQKCARYDAYHKKTKNGIVLFDELYNQVKWLTDELINTKSIPQQ